MTRIKVIQHSEAKAIFVSKNLEAKLTDVKKDFVETIVSINNFEILESKNKSVKFDKTAKSTSDYNVDELTQIVKRTSRVLNCPITDNAASELASRSRSTPRVANRLFKRVRDFALVKGNGVIDEKINEMALNKLKVDKAGLDETDYNLLKAIINKFNGGPVGIEAIASSIGEEQGTIEDVYEPYLLQLGYLKRTTRGRVVTDLAYRHLGIKK
jgi:Holliday junction DNA helicase RuvB subunit